MKITVVQKSVRQSPRKVRLVANTIKKLPVEQAIVQLGAMQRRASLVVLKTLRQAIANAQHNHGFELSSLKIDSIQVGEGTRYKRFQPVSRGRAHSIVKATCRITLTLEAKEAEAKSPVVAKTAKKADKPAVEKKASKATAKPTAVPTQSEAAKRAVQPKSEKQVQKPTVVAKPTRTKRPVAK